MLSFTKPLLLAGSLLVSLRVAAQVTGVGAEPVSASAVWTLAGTVQTGQSVPLSGAKVVAVNLQSGQRQLVVTGRQGDFQLPNLSTAGPYLIEVVLKGYEPQVAQTLFAPPHNSRHLSFSMVPVSALSVAALHVERPLMR